MQEYLLKVNESAAKDVTEWLKLGAAPTHVRLATLAPLSNYGYPSGADAAILRLNQHGVVTGQAGGDAAPHDFVPWQNVAYLSDGTSLAKEMASEKK
ncbi:MAG: hypothetical protein AB1938_17150 [Myxococcota bacterium]